MTTVFLLSTRAKWFVIAGSGLLLSASLVFTQTKSPQSKARPTSEFTSAVVPAFAPCIKPNSTTLATAGVPLPACMPATRVDSQCGFGPEGQGKIAARSVDSDVQVEAELEGLVGCEGKQLKMVMSARGTVNYCPDGECTTVDVPDFPVGACTVKNGRCSLKNNVNFYTQTNEGFKVFERGTVTNLTLFGCALVRDNKRVFECGLLVK
jgi:hypothetical protein